MNPITDKKQRLIDAGMAVILCKGYNGAGVQDIVEAAGVPKGSFYNYFASKEAFAVEGVSFLAAQSQLKLATVLSDSALPPITRLLNYFTAQINCHTASGFTGGCLLGNLCQEMADASESLRNCLENLMGTSIILMGDCLKEAQLQGDFPPQRNAQLTAEFIFYAWEGALMRMKACKNDRPLQVFMDVLRSVCLI